MASRDTPGAAAEAALRCLRGRVQRRACCALSRGACTAARALSGTGRAAAHPAHDTHLLEVAARQLPIRARGGRGTGGVLRSAGDSLRRLDLKLRGGLHRLRGDGHEGHGVRHAAWRPGRGAEAQEDEAGAGGCGAVRRRREARASGGGWQRPQERLRRRRHGVECDVAAHTSPRAVAPGRISAGIRGAPALCLRSRGAHARVARC